MNENKNNLNVEDVEEDDAIKLLTQASNDLYGLKNYEKAEKQEITMQLIIKRNLFKNDQKLNIDHDMLLPSSRSITANNDEKKPKKLDTDEQAEQLLKLTHIHLDRENIIAIDNLAEYLGPITNLYLQHNLINKIENLEFLTNLKFLVISHNQIEKVENLRCLKQLKFLDLSYNLIDDVDVDELPFSLIILDLRGNKCSLNEACNERLMRCGRNLKQLNGMQLNNEASEQNEENENEESDEDEDDDSDPEFNKNYNEIASKIDNLNDDFKKLHNVGQSIIERSKLRQREYELKSRKEFELMKLELETIQRELIEKLNQSK